MGVEKSLSDVVGISIVIDMFMMPAMLARPHQDRVLECGRAKNEDEQAHRKLRPESSM